LLINSPIVVNILS